MYLTAFKISLTLSEYSLDSRTLFSNSISLLVPNSWVGTSKEIELEKSVLESNEYSDKVSEILKAVKYIEHFLHTDGQHLEDLLYLTKGNQLYTEDGEELYIDPTSQKRTFHTQYEPGFIVAREKSPLELLIENKDLLD